MIALVFACMLVVACSASTTTPASAVTKILYDMRHHKAILVRADGCFEYHMNHQEVQDAEDDNRKHLLEAKMTQALANATAIHDVGHHHIDHMTSEIKTTCASLPIYTFESHAA